MGRWLIRLLLSAVAAQATAIPEIVLQKDLHHGRVGGVACESRECSAIGRDILARGGNAVDALVGTTFCVGVIGMYHSGIGGGGFAVVRDPSGEYEAVDFREEAPLAAFEDMFKDNEIASIVGGLAVAVPSEIRGLEYIHSKYGILPWRTVMQGAIHVAKNGFRVSNDTLYYMNDLISHGVTFLWDDPTWAEIFAPKGKLVTEGDLIIRKNYAETLSKIAEQGADVFYKGEIAKIIVDFVQEKGGILTLDDMEDYQVLTRPVKSINYRGLNLHTIGAPAGGAVSLQILKIMEHFSPDDWESSMNLSTHRFAEAMRFAYGARTKLGDPVFVLDDDVEAREAEMLDPERVEAIVQRISDERSHDPSYYNPDRLYAPDSHGTSHIVAADRSGMVISLTTTVNLLFGAMIMEPKTGIIMNNEMNDFSIPGVPNDFGFEPSPANYIRPRKRPLSSIAPIIAEFPNGTFAAAVGAAGGSRIISTSAQALWHMLDHGMGAAEALAAPRLHDQLAPDRVVLERAFGDPVARSLEGKGHNVVWMKGRISAAQGIRRAWDGTFEAASDPRQLNSEGYAL
ncbi:Gamma-glutamyltranspeptidase 1 [Escovopsis weberi]|uniref:Glutathione hydrolase n=1 Tax=Escovopsis weberi TaxID=150374 RepID=A0A0N0RU31_ESCWE|nr:Gamma-glutamyltranspeptidase 1 [Escovopsis weberi]